VTVTSWSIDPLTTLWYNLQERDSGVTIQAIGDYGTKTDKKLSLFL